MTPAPLRSSALLVLVAVLAVGVGCTSTVSDGSSTVSDGSSTVSDGTTSTLLSPDNLGTIEYVIDGDTVDIVIQGVEERVRLIGIDTPEKLGGFRDPECFGDEATAYVRSLLPEGTTVRLERDIEPRDDFGRLLAYVYRDDDDLFVNLHLVAAGYADILSIAPNTTYAEDLSIAVGAARSADLGLWGACGGSDVPLG